jgi:hypothetical protein
MTHTNQDRLCADRKEREMTDEKRAADDAERDALVIAEAALADIGDAEREPGDDLAWCERRAAQALPAVRAALSARADGGKDSSDAARWRYAIEQDWLTSAEVKAIDAAIAGDKK